MYGWVYAFFDYKPPFPLSWDKFVGLKWFKSMVENEVKLKQLLTVLRNTFAMSGISLFFSWFPMIFAVFLIADLDGLLDVLEEMMKKHPTNDAGDPCYPMSLWPDWDGGDGMLGIANVVQLTTWYGEKIKGSVILKPDGTFIPLTDKDGSYYKMLKFLYNANQRGLVDPDSATQDWNAACAKMSAGQVYLMWYSWQVGFWNSTDRLKDGTAFIFTSVADQNYYTDADSYYGSGRVFAIGS